MDDDKEIKLGAVFEQSRQNSEQIRQNSEHLGNLRKEFTGAVSDLREAIDRLGLRLNAATAPNFSTMAAWAGILLTIIGMVATPVAYYFHHAIETLDLKLQNEYRLINDTQKERENGLRASVLELDSRLQREFNVANANIKSTAEALTVSSTEARQLLAERINKLELWETDRIRADLEELRQWRTKANKP